jgi:geranylgeranyl pyrophosphate synthase
MKTEPQDTFKRWRQLINQELDQVDLLGAEQSSTLYEATTYVLRGEGKRLRALLTLAAFADLVGEVAELSLPLVPAVSMEILHAASLVHDDLPALDNDDVRRGRPSCHKAFGEATAILVGDLLVGVAIARLSAGASSALQQTLLQSMAATTWAHICVGQHLDIIKVEDVAKRETMIELKTGALFGAAMACGAICAGVSSEVVQQFYRTGVQIGVNFQRIDDIHDGEGDGAECGDIRNELRELISTLSAVGERDLMHTESVIEEIVALS